MAAAGGDGAGAIEAAGPLAAVAAAIAGAGHDSKAARRYPQQRCIEQGRMTEEGSILFAQILFAHDSTAGRDIATLSAGFD
jgi:hypothetical protein